MAFSLVDWREIKISISFAGYLVLGLSYYFLSYRPATRKIARLEELAKTKEGAVTKSRKELTEITSSPMLRSSVKLLQLKLQTIEKERSKERQRLADLQTEFLPPNDTETFQDLKFSISSLATDSDVRIKESVPYTPPTVVTQRRANPASREQIGAEQGEPDRETLIVPSGPFVPVATVEKLSGHYFQRLVVESTFPALQQFLRELHQLKWRVTIVRTI